MTKSGSKRRLDVAVAEQLGVSRTRAQALILEGRVRVNGDVRLKSGELLPADARLEVEDQARFVSRGGLKLERALDEFGWSPAGLRCVDIGASTGGFTDCLLQRGAASVAALDVGYGQLAWQLRNDPRVTVFERTNARYVTPDQVGGPFQFAVADASFISLAMLAPALAALLLPGARCIVLVKPQFEAGREWVARGGVVRDPRGHEAAIESVVRAFASQGLVAERLTLSPLHGPAGNVEFLLGATRASHDVVFRASAASLDGLDIAGVVRRAHEAPSS